MTPERATELIGDLIDAIAKYKDVWQRGGKGTREAKAQKRAIVNIFVAMTGEQPSDTILNDVLAAECVQLR